MATVISKDEAYAHPSDVIDRAMGGEEIDIEQGGRVKVRLVPVTDGTLVPQKVPVRRRLVVMDRSATRKRRSRSAPCRARIWAGSAASTIEPAPWHAYPVVERDGPEPPFCRRARCVYHDTTFAGQPGERL